MKSIVYKSETGVAVVHPAPECPRTLEEIAQKDVPAGAKYKFIELTELPQSREFRNAWEVDESELTDGVGA